MFSRLAVLIIPAFWLASMNWLFWRDVWPGLTAGEAPEIARASLARDEHAEFQVGIFNRDGNRLGTIWTTHTMRDTTMDRTDVMHMEPQRVIGSMVMRMDSVFTDDGRLDELTLLIQGDALPRSHGRDTGQILIHGERYASTYGFVIEAGEIVDTVRVNEDEAGMITDAFRPFAALPGLYVGQSWRMQIINPLSAMLGVGGRFTSVLVQVTGAQTITTADGRAFDCLTVETENVKAWVDRGGRVILQQVDFPLIGRIELRDEPFSLKGMRSAEREIG